MINHANNRITTNNMINHANNRITTNNMINANNRITPTNMINQRNKLMTYFFPRGGRFLAALCAGFSVQRRNQMLLSALLLLSSFALLPDVFAQTVYLSYSVTTDDGYVVSFYESESKYHIGINGATEDTRTNLAIANHYAIAVNQDGHGVYQNAYEQHADPCDVSLMECGSELRNPDKSFVTSGHGYPGFEPTRPFTVKITITPSEFFSSDGLQRVKALVTFPTPTLPSQITDLAATAGDGAVELTWTASNLNGGTFAHYTITYGGETVRITPHPTTSTTIPNLNNGEEYTFTIITHRSAGSSLQSNAVTATPVGLSSQITDLGATAGVGTVTLTWTAPNLNGGTFVNYHIYYDAGGAIETIPDYSTTSRTITFPNVAPQTFSIRTETSAGLSLESNTVTATPAGLPSQITDLAATAGDGEVTLTWTRVFLNGGIFVNYDIIYGNASETSSNYRTTSITIPDLNNGENYTFTVKTVTSAGSSLQSNAVTVTPVGLPSQITDLAATAGDGTVTLSWTPPDNGGSPLTEYVLTATSSDGSTVPPIPQPVVTTTTAMISHPVPGLTNGVLYTFALVARSLAGDSPSAEVPATPAGLPDAINDLTAVAGDGTVTLSWTPPADGGSPLTEYVLTATSSDGSTVPPIPQPVVTTTTAMISHPVPGLTNGVLYTFALVARSLAGDSPSAEVPATPAGLPDAINDLTAVAGDGTVTLSWTPPADGGSPLTEYVLTATSSDGSTVPPIPQPVVTTTTAMISHPVPGLTNGITYTFSLSANNAVDDGPVVSATATPVPKPEAVTGLTSTPGNGQLTLNWTAPVNNNGAPPIILYGIIVTPDDGESSVQTLVTGTSTSYTVPNLTNGVGHTVVVFARNASGDSPVAFIAPETSTTPRADIAATAPAEVSNLTAAVSDGTVTLKWLTPANGGSSLTDYVLLITLPDGSAFPLLTQPSGTDITYTVSGLTNGTTYTFSLAATNAVGHGPAVSATATPAAAPGAVTNLTAVAGDGQIMLTWSAPELNGSTLTGYKVDYPGFPALTVDASATSTTITGLTNGVAYTFNVTPQSTNGDGVQVEVTATPVIKKLQTITFILSSAGVVGDTLDLSATASSMLEVTYSSSNSSIAEVGTGTEEGKLILKAGGDAMITASQAGDAQYTATEVTHTITVSESVVLSVDVKNTDIRVWPNPVATQLNISSGSRGKLSITLRNLTGQRLQEGEFEGKGQMDVSHLPAGVYLLYIRTAEEATSYLIYKK